MATEFDPDSIRPGVPTIGSPPKPAGVPDDEAHSVIVLRNPDGTKRLSGASGLPQILDAQQSLSWPSDGSRPRVLTLSPRDAALLGLYRIIEHLTWWSFDLQEVAERGDVRASVRGPYKLTKVHLDWPDGQQKQAMPAQTALITAPEPAPFDAAGWTPRLLPETQDRFLPGTVLRYIGVQEVAIQLVIWTAHKDQRRGLEGRLTNLLGGESRTDRGGRRIILPEYFSREIRYTLDDTARPVSAEAARAGEWVLDVSVTAEVAMVELVTIPGVFDGAQFDVEAT